MIGNCSSWVSVCEYVWGSLPFSSFHQHQFPWFPKYQVSNSSQADYFLDIFLVVCHNFWFVLCNVCTILEEPSSQVFLPSFTFSSKTYIVVVPTLFFTPTILSNTHNMHAHMKKKNLRQRKQQKRRVEVMKRMNAEKRNWVKPSERRLGWTSPTSPQSIGNPLWQSYGWTTTDYSKLSLN